MTDHRKTPDAVNELMDASPTMEWFVNALTHELHKSDISIIKLTLTWFCARDVVQFAHAPTTTLTPTLIWL